MAKKKSQPKPEATAVVATRDSPSQVEIIAAEDVVDLGGMTPEAFHRAVYDGVQEALGQADVKLAGAILDETLAEYLEVVDAHCGPAESRDAAINFARTVLPYAIKGLPDPEGQKYGQLRVKKDD
jgi:hypothetical protein